MLGKNALRRVIHGLERATSAERLRLICVGQLTVDTVVTLPTSLAVGDQAVGDFTTVPGGTAAIVAHNAAILGGRPTFVGHVGRSRADKAAARRLKEAGVRFGRTVSSSFGARVLVLVEPHGERTMIGSGEVPNWRALDFYFRPDDLVYFEGWHLFNDTSRRTYGALIERAISSGAMVALDVCSATRSSDPAGFATVLEHLGVHVVFANEAEATTYDLLRQPPASLMVIHRGVASTVILANDVRILVPVDPSPSRDTTGAGDTFAAGFLLALSAGAAPDAAAASGNSAARRIVDVSGALLPHEKSNRACGVHAGRAE